MTDTKNKIREVMLRQAITTCVTSGHNVDLETITKLRILPPDFFTGDPSDHSEIAETLLEMQREADAQSASLAPAPTEPPLAAEPEAEARRVVEGNTPQASDLYVPKLTLVEAHEQLAQVKQLLPQALDAQRVARVAMSRAINQFRKANGGTP